MKKVLAVILALCMLLSLVPMALTVSAQTAVSNIVFDNGDMEDSPLQFAGTDAGGKAVSTLSSEIKKNGEYSNKLYFPADATGHATLWLESNQNYDMLPLEEYIYVTFWAKADDEVGFNGAVLINDTAQYDSGKGNKTRIDGGTGQFAIGSGLGSNGWAEVSKVWTKYYAPVSSATLADTADIDFEILVSMICVAGNGIIYLDDINVEAQNPSLIDNGNYEESDDLVKYDGNASAYRTTEEKHSGRYAAKIVSTDNNKAEFKIYSEYRYDDIPKGEQLMLSFWAKADENAGFTGMAGAGNIHQATGLWDYSCHKLDGYMWNYAFGTSDSDPTKFETLSSDWTKYYMLIPTALVDSEDYYCFFADFRITGTGTLYLDDFDLEVVDDVLDNGTVNDGGSEKGCYAFSYSEGASSVRVTDRKHSGNSSTKISGTNDSIVCSVRVSSTEDHYAKIPLNTGVYLTFWAKADDETGFSGFMGTGNIYQGTAEDERANKLDGSIMTPAFGSADMQESGFVEISKEWTKYFIKVNNPFAEGYVRAYSDINIKGYGVLYLDDFAFEVVDESLLDNIGFGANMSLGAINLSVRTANIGNCLTSDVYSPDTFLQSIKVSNTTSDEAIGNLRVDVKNGSGATVYTKLVSVDVAAREYDLFDISITGLTEFGKYTIAYSYTDAKGTHTASSEFSNVRKNDISFGAYNVCLAVGNETDAKYNSIFEALSNSGAQYFRTDIRWETVETTKGVYAFPEYFERMFASAQRYGMKPLVCVNYKNALYGDVNSDDFFADTSAVEAYAAYTSKIVESYADYIDAIEIYNEPNYLDVPAEDYAALLKASYTAIKAVKSSVKVIGCSTSTADSSYIGAVIDNGAGDYMDIVSVHPYVYNKLIYTPERIVTDINAVVGTMSAKNCNKPVWVTELNWPTNDSENGYTEAEQAEYITRAILSLKGEGVAEKVFVYTAFDFNTGSDDTEDVFGIFKSANYPTSNAAKLSYVALSQLANATGGKAAAGTLSLGTSVKAYKYGDNVTAIWSISGNNTVNITVEGSARVYDIYGNMNYVASDNGTVQITVGSAPVYVVDHISGDVTEDGNLSIVDLVRFKKKLSLGVTTEAMDVSEDYAVDSLDLTELRKKLLNNR